MRIVKPILKALLLLLLLLLVAYGVYYYQVKSAIDSHLQQMRPLIDAKYNSLYVNPLGDIQLGTVTVNPMGQPSGFVIDRVRLASDPLFFLRFESRIASGNWPESLALAVEGLIIDFNMPLFAMLEQFAQQGELTVQPAAFGCGSVSHFDMTAMRMMGMRQGPFDLDVNLNKTAPNQLELELLSSMYGWAELAIHLGFQADHASPQTLSQLGSQMKQFSVSYKDMGYNQRKNQFCAMQSGMSVAEYRETHLDLMQAWLDEIDPQFATQLMPAYKELGESGARVALSLNLDGLSLQSLAAPDYLEKALGSALNVTVNDKPLRLDSTQLNSLMAKLQEPLPNLQDLPDIADSDAPVSDAAPRDMPGVASPPVPMRSMEPLKYRKTDPLELENYLGHPVRFYTTFGKRVEGILVGVDEGRVRVAERVQRGMAEYPVELETIQDTEVMR